MNFKVLIRIRQDTNQKDNNQLILQLPNNIKIQKGDKIQDFTFDMIADENSSQEEIFSYTGKDMLQRLLDGQNGCIFTYGQSGSGKSYTLWGRHQIESENEDQISDDDGLIQRIVNELITRKNQSEQIFIKLYEIYNEQIFDIIDPSQKKITIRENKQGDVVLDGLNEKNISNLKQLRKLLQNSQQYRHIFGTCMNRESSRCHTIATIEILKSNQQSSKLHLVDLAGLERSKITNVEGIHLKEANYINKSLLNLGNVISKLNELDKIQYISFRDTKLTHILKDTFKNQSNVSLIGTICQGKKYALETITTLNFAQKFSQLQSKSFEKNESIEVETIFNIKTMQKQLVLTNKFLKKNLEILFRNVSQQHILNKMKNMHQYKQLQWQQISQTYENIIMKLEDNQIQNIIPDVDFLYDHQNYLIELMHYLNILEIDLLDQGNKSNIKIQNSKDFDDFEIDNNEEIAQTSKKRRLSMQPPTVSKMKKDIQVNNQQ